MEKRYDRASFTERFAEVVADSDYSKDPGLRALTSYDIDAASLALWSQLLRTKAARGRSTVLCDLTKDVALRVLKNLEAAYMDDNHLVSVHFEGYWDATDSLSLSSGLRKQMEEELAGKARREMERDGLTVVENVRGIFVFDLREV